MIPTKHACCCTFIAAYLARYGTLRLAELPSGSTYTRADILAALREVAEEDADGRWEAKATEG